MAIASSLQYKVENLQDLLCFGYALIAVRYLRSDPDQMQRLHGRASSLVRLLLEHSQHRHSNVNALWPPESLKFSCAMGAFSARSFARQRRRSSEGHDDPLPVAEQHGDGTSVSQGDVQHIGEPTSSAYRSAVPKPGCMPWRVMGDGGMSPPAFLRNKSECRSSSEKLWPTSRHQKKCAFPPFVQLPQTAQMQSVEGTHSGLRPGV